MDSNTFNQLTPAQKLMVAQFAKTLTQTPTPSTSSTATSTRKRQLPAPKTTTCPNCGIVLQRKSLMKHQEKTCPKRTKQPQTTTNLQPTQPRTTPSKSRLLYISSDSEDEISAVSDDEQSITTIPTPKTP